MMLNFQVMKHLIHVHFTKYKLCKITYIKMEQYEVCRFHLKKLVTEAICSSYFCGIYTHI